MLIPELSRGVTPDQIINTYNTVAVEAGLPLVTQETPDQLQAALFMIARAAGVAVPQGIFTPEQVIAGFNAVIIEIGNLVSSGSSMGVATLFAVSRTGRYWGSGASPVFRPVASGTFPPGAITPNMTLRFEGQFVKYAPDNSASAMNIVLSQGANSIIIGQASLDTTIGNFSFAQIMSMSDDAKWGYLTTGFNIFAAGSSVALLNCSPYLVSVDQQTGYGCRATGTVGFASYSTSPTVETILINFAAPVNWSIQYAALANDSAELMWATCTGVTNVTPENYAPSNATLWAGDSLTEGTGASPNNDVVNQLAKLRLGRPVVNFGLGGQTSSQIAPRVLACQQELNWDMILWIGENDASPDVPTWFGMIQTYVDQIIAARTNPHLVIVNLIPDSYWPAQYLAAMQATNAHISSTYGSLVADICTPLLVGGSDGQVNPAYVSSSPHLNDTGYGIVATTVSNVMTANGWATP